MERKWWHGKTAYQIYPKSYRDTNGDGIGDLPGVIEKLDYLKELGVDIVWLSPIYCSPLADQGYDISDYYNIDPRFGTMEDMDRLLAEAKKRDMHILMDLVVNHCSDEHEWFRKACEDPDGKYGKYFYICDWKEGEPLPTNWRSYFGGSCWDLLPGHTDKVYLHMFHKKQPDLNWENPEVKEDIYKMINWWLEKGLSGFRIDAIINIKKVLPFKDYPVDRADGMSSLFGMLEEAQGVEIMLQELADETFRKYDALTVGEVFNEKPWHVPMFIGDNGCFSSMFDFSTTIINQSENGWYDQKPVTPEQYKAAVFGSQERTADIGYKCNIIENHDEPRGVSHYIPEGECSIPAKKMLGGLCFMLRGLPFLYQGQEIGMENLNCTSIDQVDDISARNEYQVCLDNGMTPAEAMKVVNRYSRDNARTPMHWDATANAGFTTGTPWLQVNPNYTEINLASQIDDPDSVYSFYKKLLALRKNPDYQEAVVYGQTVPYLADQQNLFAYHRKADKDLLVLGNFQTQPQDVVLPGEVKAVLLNNMDTCAIDGGKVTMEGYQFLVLEI